MFNLFSPYEWQCLTCFILSLAGVVISLGVCIANRNKEVGFKRLTGFNAFQTYTICFFLFVIPIFFPGYYDMFSSDVCIVREIKSILLSAHNTVRLFILDGDFEIIRDIVGKTVILDNASVPCLRDWIGYCYSLYASVLFIAAPILTAGIVLSLFKNVFEFFKFRKKEVDTIYFISELNDRSIVLAENILKDKDSKEHRVAFFDVHEVNEEVSSELVEKAKKLGTICFYRDIVDAYLVPRAKKAKRKFYFISENEDKNVKQALALIKICRDNELYNTENTAFYVFATTPDSELLLDAADNGNMIERRVNENKNLVISTLMEEPIFNKGHYTLDKKTGLKHVTFLIVGSGSYGTELIKALSWCGQIPEYRVHIHVVDKEKNAKDRFEAIAPGLKARNFTDKITIDEYASSFVDPLVKKHPIYDITFYNEVDVHGSQFINIIKQIKNINTVFVTLGNDSINVSVAMLVRRELKRLKIDEPNTPIANIYSVVYSAVKNETLSQNDALCSNTDDISNIHFIGNIRTRYSIPIIEQRKLEEDGFDIHMDYCMSKYKDCPIASIINARQWLGEYLEIKRKFESDIKKLEDTRKKLLKAKKNLGRIFKKTAKIDDKIDELGAAIVQIAQKQSDYEATISRGNPNKSKEDLELIKADVISNARTYGKNEYSRRSSIATVVHGKVLNRIKFIDSEDVIKHVEHIRWMAYIESEGFVYKAEKNSIAKTHDKLVPFEMLDPEIQDLDAVALQRIWSCKDDEGENAE